MNLFKFSSISFLFLFSFILVTPAFAVETTPVVKTTTTAVKPAGDVVVLATVNIQNAKIVSQEINKFHISFDISNREGTQSGVKYGVKLIKELGKSNVVVDEYIYPEVLSISANTTTKKEIVYIAPSNINGSYTIVVSLKNYSGLPLGSGIAGKVKIISTLKTVEILPDTCVTYIAGKETSNKTPITNSVSISPKDNLVLTCGAVNNGKTEISVTPIYETYLRSTYGSVTEQTGGDVTPIVFKAGEKKTISLSLPKATAPQLYGVKVSLKQGDEFSNSVVVYYMIKGLSATIQNFSLDKDYYNKNDTAKIAFFYNASSGDEKLAPSITLTASIVNEKGKNCITPINQVLTKVGLVEIPANIITNCINPKASIELKDDKGNILDQKQLSFKTNEQPSKANNTIIYIIIIVLAIIGFLYYRKNKKISSVASSNNDDISSSGSVPLNIILPFFMLMALLGLIPTSKVSADTFSYQNYVIEANLDRNTNSSYIIQADSMFVSVDVYDALSSPYYGNISAKVDIATPTVVTENLWTGNLLPIAGYNITYTQIGSERLPFTAGGYDAGIILTLTNDWSHEILYSGYLMGLPFIMSEPPVTVTPPTPPAPAPALGVVVTANNSNPLTISSNNNGVDVIWKTSGNPTSCVCTYGSGIPCGTGIGTQHGTNLPTKLTSNTTFNVTCTDVDIGTPPSTPTYTPSGYTCPSYYPSCFIADTVVQMADGTTKNIQDVKIGDVLKGEKTNNKVLGFHDPKLNDKKLYSFNGGRYFVTAEHPFKTIDGWKSINPALTAKENIGIKVTELKVGDTLITENGKVLLKTIKSKNDKADTQLYNFILDGDHTYYADQYLVHNKLACMDGQVPNIAGGCDYCGLGCLSGYTKSCTGGATLCTLDSCTSSGMSGACVDASGSIVKYSNGVCPSGTVYVPSALN